ncbi:hypothetical protein STEG23_006989 [Scotinomys teguina]
MRTGANSLVSAYSKGQSKLSQCQQRLAKNGPLIPSFSSSYGPMRQHGQWTSTRTRAVAGSQHQTWPSTAACAWRASWVWVKHRPLRSAPATSQIVAPTLLFRVTFGGNTDLVYSGTVDPEVVPSSSLGLDVTIAPDQCFIESSSEKLPLAVDKNGCGNPQPDLKWREYLNWRSPSNLFPQSSVNSKEEKAKRLPHFEQEASAPHTAVPQVQKAIDPKFQFLNHLPKSKVFEFPGGAIQCARYRNNIKDYLSDEEEAFGTSSNSLQSQMTLGTLRIKSKGLRAPHWHFNANEHDYLVQGTAWIGVVDDGGEVATTYSVTTGQVIFFPKNTLHWITNVGHEDFFFLLFFSTNDELQTLDVDDVFFLHLKTFLPGLLSLKVELISLENFRSKQRIRGVNLPPNLAKLVMNASYIQSPDIIVWRYFFDLKGSKEYKFPRGVIQ